jgi:outer membrane protein assembly factor BamB
MTVPAPLRRAGLTTGLALVLLPSAGCLTTPDAASPVEPSTLAPYTPVTPTPEHRFRQGAAPAWTTALGGWDAELAKAGDVAVLAEETKLRGLSWSTGAGLWQRSIPAGNSRTWSVVAGGLIAITTPDRTRRVPAHRLEVLQASDGRTRWTTRASVRQVAVYADAAYLFDCTDRTSFRPTGCTITSRDLRTGRQRWRIPTRSGTTGVDGSTAIGQEDRIAPASGRHLTAKLGPDGRRGDRPYAALDSRTGVPLAGRIPHHSWYALMVGNSFVTTDNDPPPGVKACPVAIRAFDARTGARRWSTTLYSGREADGACVKSLGPLQNRLRILGHGSRIAAAGADGRPVLFDLAAGRRVWTGSEPGTVVAGDRRALLVRTRFDAGGLSLLDARTGRRRWKAPDPGEAWSGVSRNAHVGSRLVVVDGDDPESPDGRASASWYVTGYDARTGRQLTRSEGHLAGAGDDWLAVAYLDEDLMPMLELVEL